MAFTFCGVSISAIWLIPAASALPPRTPCEIASCNIDDIAGTRSDSGSARIIEWNPAGPLRPLADDD